MRPPATWWVNVRTGGLMQPPDGSPRKHNVVALCNNTPHPPSRHPTLVRRQGHPTALSTAAAPTSVFHRHRWSIGLFGLLSSIPST